MLITNVSTWLIMYLHIIIYLNFILNLWKINIPRKYLAYLGGKTNFQSFVATKVRKNGSNNNIRDFWTFNPCKVWNSKFYLGTYRGRLYDLQYLIWFEKKNHTHKFCQPLLKISSLVEISGKNVSCNQLCFGLYFFCHSVSCFLCLSHFF